MRYADVGVQNGGGAYSFTRGWTTSNPQVDDRNTDNAIASFLLGDVNSASAPLNASPYLIWKANRLPSANDVRHHSCGNTP